MKNLYSVALCLCLTLVATRSVTQPIREPDLNRPKLFQLLPDTISTDISRLVNLFTISVGHPVSIEISDIVSFIFHGDIISNTSKYDNRIQSIVVRSQNYPGAKLSFASATLDDGRVVYQGKIMSFTHGDLFDLREFGANYYFIKKGFYQVVNE
jgi:hypothetical protein